jgi:hypothetical protein
MTDENKFSKDRVLRNVKSRMVSDINRGIRITTAFVRNSENDSEVSKEILETLSYLDKLKQIIKGLNYNAN